MKLRDLTGQVFGRLTVTQRDAVYQGRRTMWVCVCICGEVKSVDSCNLLSGKQLSCGCYGKEVRTIHGMSSMPVYQIWEAMIGRCCNPKNPNYKNYLGRGITVCDRWRSFENFFNDMGSPPEGLTLERKDNNLGYSPENCMWASRADQARNKRGVHLITFNGRTQVLQDWANQYGIRWSVLYRRLYSWGWPMSTALSAPVMRGVPRWKQERFLGINGIAVSEALEVEVREAA